MGQKDISLVRYFEDQGRYADLIDCVRKVVFGMGFAVIGIENQDKIHYSMPVRIMLEDAGEYDKQLRQIKRYHRNKRDLREDEFLGGIAREDKVYPAVTICIYYGNTPYDGAKELYEMMDCNTLPQKLRKLVNNYKMIRASKGLATANCLNCLHVQEFRTP